MFSRMVNTSLSMRSSPPGGIVSWKEAVSVVWVVADVSDVFTVLLNNQNALHTQSGDWINVSRELLRLIIESASGGQLRGQLIYTERYL